MERNELIKFGIFHESSHNHDSADITSTCVVDNNSFIITTLSKVIKMNGSIILDTAPMQFSHSVYVEKYELVIAISIHSSNIFVFPTNEIGRPIISNFPTTQRIVSFLVYSPKSESIITIGDKIKIWSMKVVQLSKMIRATVTITHSHTFKGTFNISSYNNVGFDTDKEILYLPTEDGILPYTIFGEALPTIAKVSTTISTIFCYSNVPKELLLSDRTNGLSVWSNIGTFVKRIPFGGSSISFIDFIDDENVVIVDDLNAIYILNVKSNRSMLCTTTSRRPLSVFCVKTRVPVLLVAFEDHFELFSVLLEWKVWALNVVRPVLSKVQPKKCARNRFLVQTENSFAKIYSPIDGKPITAATPSCAAFPVSVLYDRGCYIHHVRGEYGSFVPQMIEIDSNRDFLIMNLDNDQTVVFDALTAPMKEVCTMNLKTRNIVQCVFNDEWCYAIHADVGEVSIIDYNRFLTIEKFKLTNTRIVGIFYHHPTKSLIVHYESELIRFSLSEKVILGRIPISIQSTFSELFADSIFIADKSGKIHKFNIDDEKIISKDVNEINGHLTAVSHISFSPDFMISSSFDGSVVIWDYSFNKVAQITAPLPIFCCCFLNGSRDVILGTETELMKMDGEVIFKGEKDAEYEVIDNFNKNDDILMKESSELNIKLSSISSSVKNSPQKREKEKEKDKKETKGRSLYRERIEKLKQKVAEMNRKKEEEERKMMEEEKREKEGKRQIDENARRRIIDQMVTLTIQGAREEPNASEIVDGTPSIQFQPQVPQSENTNNPRLNQNENKSASEVSRSSSRSSKSVCNSESDEETIRSRGKNFLKKSIVKDEKVRQRKEKRQRRQKERKEKERQQKELQEKIESMKKIEHQKTEQEILLDSMDTTLTIGDISTLDEAEPEPEIFFRQPVYTAPQISRPTRKAATVRRYTPSEFKEKMDEQKKSREKESEQNENEKDEEREEKQGRGKKMNKKKKNLNNRLKRTPTPPDVRKQPEEKKEHAKKKRSKTLPNFSAPPKVIEFEKVVPVVDSKVVQEAFMQKKPLVITEPVQPPDNRQPINNSIFVDIATDVISSDEKIETIEKEEIEQPIEKVEPKTETQEPQEEEVPIVHSPITVKPQQPPQIFVSVPSPPPSSPSSLKTEPETVTNFQVRPPSEPKHKAEMPNQLILQEAPKPIGPPLYLTEVDDESKIRQMIDNLLDETATTSGRRKNVTFRDIERTLRETKRKIDELEEERQIDPLAWRGVPPKLEKMKVKSIEFFDDDPCDYNQSLFLKYKGKRESVIRSKRSGSRSSRSSSVESRSSSLNSKKQQSQKEDPSALEFLSNWNARKAQRSRRLPSSTRRTKVSRVEKNKPWM